MSLTDRRYLMEDSREAGRLAAKVDPDAWVDKYLPRVEPSGSRILDVGSGPGHISLAVARRHPASRVVAFDISAGRVGGLTPGQTGQSVSACVGDAARLPFEDESFDLAYCRLLLEYLPRPEAAVAEIYRVLRPGGRILLYDLDGQLLWHDPPDAELDRNIDTMLAALRRTGFDPHIGRRLYNLTYTAGFVEIATEVEPYHLIPGSVTSEERARWQLKLDIARPALAHAVSDPATTDAVIESFLAYLDRDDTLVYSTAFAVSGKRPAG